MKNHENNKNRMTRGELAERIDRLVTDVMDTSVESLRSFLPFSMVMIPPGRMEMITAKPQAPFRGDRLAVWGVTAPHFMISMIRVGNRHMGVSCGDAPADVFATRLDLLPFLDAELAKNGMVTIKITKRASECFGQPLALPVARPGYEVILGVENVSNEPQRFAAVLLGDELAGYPLHLP